MEDLFTQPADLNFASRAISPLRELGAYEALWDRKGAWFKSIADDFRAHAGALPSDFVSAADAARYSRLALTAIREAGIKRFGIRVHGAGEYPEWLRDSDHPVELLYFQGLWDLVNNPCVAIVGTRHPSAEGRKRAVKITRLCIDDGYTIVSGLARGIDTVAHTTAMSQNGRTIAVLGTPITETYPSENRELQQKIADEHLVISQVPIVRYAHQHFKRRPHFFPERNATISALTRATIIVEAGETSGTLVQARHALKQKRQLFILESCFHNTALTWPARFAAMGALRVADYDDIKKHLASADAFEFVAD